MSETFYKLSIKHNLESTVMHPSPLPFLKINSYKINPRMCLKHVFERVTTIKYNLKLSTYLLICRRRLSDLWGHWYSLWTSCYARIFTFRVCWFCIFWHHWWCFPRWIILCPLESHNSDLFTLQVGCNEKSADYEVWSVHHLYYWRLLLLRHVTLSFLLPTSPHSHKKYTPLTTNKYY